jgi:uncharacterized protein YigE (DUF2233 family)
MSHAKILIFSVWFTMLTLANAVAAAEFSTVKIAGKKVTICRVNIRKERLRLFHRDQNGQPFKRFDLLDTWLQKSRHQKLVFAMNAGMYHSDFSSVGLYIADGQQFAPLNIANSSGNFFLKPNGVFAVTETGTRIFESSEYPRTNARIMLATQSGPLLVHNGKIHPKFLANSTSRLIRNGVGVPSPDTAIFAISEDPLNFYEFATLFRDKLHCPNALYFDGTVSSLYSTKLNRHDFKTNLGPMIGITQALQSTPAKP